MDFDINKEQLVTLHFSRETLEKMCVMDIYQLVENSNLEPGEYLFVGNDNEFTMFNADIRKSNIPYDLADSITVEREYNT